MPAKVTKKAKPTGTGKAPIKSSAPEKKKKEVASKKPVSKKVTPSGDK